MYDHLQYVILFHEFRMHHFAILTKAWSKTTIGISLRIRERGMPEYLTKSSKKWRLVAPSISASPPAFMLLKKKHSCYLSRAMLYYLLRQYSELVALFDSISKVMSTVFLLLFEVRPNIRSLCRESVSCHSRPINNYMYKYIKFCFPVKPYISSSSLFFNGILRNHFKKAHQHGLRGNLLLKL